MAAEDINRDLEELQAQLTALNVSLGVVLGGLRAAGHIGADEQRQIIDAILAAGRYAPGIPPGTWGTIGRLAGSAAEAMTLDAGAITLKPLE